MKPKVLFVDDDESILNALRRLFRKEPYDVQYASDADQGLAIVQSFEPAVVVSDYRMPGMNGVEFLAKVKELDHSTVRIMLTGQMELKIAEEAINRGEVYRFITKPWVEEELRSAIASATERFDLLQENRRLVGQLTALNASLEAKVRERTRELEQRQAELVQSEKLASVGMLAGGIAHELNNPIGGILAFAQILKNEVGPNFPQLEDLRQIEEGAQRCKRIVRDLLDFARVSRSDEKVKTDLSALFEKALTLVQVQAKGQPVEVVRDFSPQTPHVIVNPNRIQQVFVNLIANAYQAMGRTGGRIRLETHQEKDYVVATVEDTGPGIPPDHRARIFDPFFTTKPVGQGTGLGLSVSYGIVKEHGGDIQVDSPKEGTRFRVLIPLESAQSEM